MHPTHAVKEIKCLLLLFPELHPKGVVADEDIN
jgi:hypothetical protein